MGVSNVAVRRASKFNSTTGNSWSSKSATAGKRTYGSDEYRQAGRNFRPVSIADWLSGRIITRKWMLRRGDWTQEGVAGAG
ncbi:hypothetical protein KCP69_19105 [Salmonella enterica subsp. enterica]|nr:hypothetical protein KCP69_19105 [Salmonella enterica subsp. enterica]